MLASPWMARSSTAAAFAGDARCRAKPPDPADLCPSPPVPSLAAAPSHSLSEPLHRAAALLPVEHTFPAAATAYGNLYESSQAPATNVYQQSDHDEAATAYGNSYESSQAPATNVYQQSDHDEDGIPYEGNFLATGPPTAPSSAANILFGAATHGPPYEAVQAPPTSTSFETNIHQEGNVYEGVDTYLSTFLHSDMNPGAGPSFQANMDDMFMYDDTISYLDLDVLAEPHNAAPNQQEARSPTPEDVQQEN